jgi:hypothetical protein
MYFLFESILPDLIDDSCLTFCELLVGKPQHYDKVVNVAEEKIFRRSVGVQHRSTSRPRQNKFSLSYSRCERL